MTAQYDVVIIGAGLSGLYSVHKFRNELGLNVQAFDAGESLGGTWWANRYPGARCDIESVHYSYSFSPEIQKNWQWSEKYASQREILAYMDYVAETLDLRRSFQFDTRVTGAIWDDAGSVWRVSTDDGQTCTTRFLIAATGVLSIPKRPDIDGIEHFRGAIYSTAAWPKEPVDFAGKRVGVVGTGSTGIQVIQEVAGSAAHLTVFQRTPNYVMPLRNQPVPPERRAWLAQNHEAVRAGTYDSLMGVPFDLPRPTFRADPPEERRAHYEDLWRRGGFQIPVAGYGDLLFDQAANDDMADFVRGKIREQVGDADKAARLVPFDHPIGTKRPAFGDTYYDALARDTVDVVDIRATPLARMSEKSLFTSDTEYPLDILIFATGFDAMTGSFLNLGLEGRDGVTLADYWAEGPRTYLGAAMHGFPNFFTILGPPPPVYNNALLIEEQVEFVADAIAHALATGATVMEAAAEADERCRNMAEYLLGTSLTAKANSWFTGGNIEGKVRAAYILMVTVPVYRALLASIRDSGFGGFLLDGAPRPLPPLIRLDPAAIALMNLQAALGETGKTEKTLAEVRGGVEQMVNLQAPPSDVDVVETHYESDGEARAARIYTPRGESRGGRPMLVFFHGGGFVAGSLNIADRPCRALAEDLDAIVIAASYRLAPEHPFPAAVDDSYAALRWAASIAGDHGGATDRLFVGGESAGAYLAAITAQRARDEGGPALAGQILIQPVIDIDPGTPSRTEFANGPFLTAEQGEASWRAYFAGADVDVSSPLISPARAPSLAGLPPALILTGECDMLRDEGEDYGAKLAAAGVPATVRRFAGLPHGVFSLSGIIPRSRELNDAIVTFVETATQRRPVELALG